MAINFTKNVEQYTTINRATRAKQFMEFTSKKQLQTANVLTDKELLFVTGIKGTFNFALHNDGRYMAVTIYRSTAERKYNFLILDLQEQAVAEVGSIKEAKAEILALISASDATAEEVAETAETVETPAEDVADETAADAQYKDDAQLADTIKDLLKETFAEETEPAKKDRKSGKTA